MRCKVAAAVRHLSRQQGSNIRAHHWCTFSASAHTQHAVSLAEKVRTENAADVRWARTKGAAAALRQPPFTEKLAKTTAEHEDLLASLDTYLEAREWHYPSEPSARRFLSHLLTYPLTLASALREAKLDDMARASVVCVGARAEGSLPSSLWLETIIALPELLGLHLHLLGPEVPIPSRIPTAPEAALEGKGPTASMNLNVAGERSLLVNWMQIMLGAAVGAKRDGVSKVDSTRVAVEGAKKNPPQEAMERWVDETVEKADAFVFFNPGLGHPHLMDGWQPAAERILQTGAPIIVTCHSEEDLDRDYRQLNSLGERCFGKAWTEGRGKSIVRRKNVFRSLRDTVDPLSPPENPELVAPNWGMMVIEAEPK